MVVEYEQIENLTPYPDNPRRWIDVDVSRLAESIRRNPELFEARPVIVSKRKDGAQYVLGGHLRLEAAKRLGKYAVPVYRFVGLTEAKEREILLRDNIQNGEWDWDLLTNKWADCAFDDWGLDDGFEATDKDEFEKNNNLNDLTKSDYQEDGDDLVHVNSTDEYIKLGDIVEFKKNGALLHKLICGDSTDQQIVQCLMDGQKAAMCFTDPPYGVSYMGGGEEKMTIKNDNLDEVELASFFKKACDSIDTALAPGAYLLATVPPGPLHLIFANEFKSRGWLRQIMVWNKNSLVLGHSEYHYKHEPILFGWKEGDRLRNTDRTKTTVWDFNRPQKSEDHPTMKPIPMWVYGINNHTKELDIVFEPFSGSGTSLVACQSINRRCYAIELDPMYAQRSIERMRKNYPDIDIYVNNQKL